MVAVLGKYKRICNNNMHSNFGLIDGWLMRIGFYYQKCTKIDLPEKRDDWDAN